MGYRKSIRASHHSNTAYNAACLIIRQRMPSTHLCPRGGNVPICHSQDVHSGSCAAYFRLRQSGTFAVSGFPFSSTEKMGTQKRVFLTLPQAKKTWCCNDRVRPDSNPTGVVKNRTGRTQSREPDIFFTCGSVKMYRSAAGEKAN